MLVHPDLLKHSVRHGGGVVAWEVINQVLELKGDIQPFLEENTDLGPATRSKMLSILQDPRRTVVLQIEVAALVDAGKQFVQATYRLE